MFLLLLFSASLASADDSCGLLQVEEVQGAVSYRVQEAEAHPLFVEDTLEPGETVLTGAGSWADLRHCDGTAQRIGENSEFTYEESSAGEGSWLWAFSLLRGSIRALVSGSGQSEVVKFRLRTPTASLGVRGTEFVVDAEAEETSLHTLEGEVLMGAATDWENLRELKASHMARFQKVKKERFSRVKAGGRAQSPKRFHSGQFQKARQKLLFRSEMRKTQGFRSLMPGKRGRPVFQRNSSAIQRRMEKSRSRKQNTDNKSGKATPRAGISGAKGSAGQRAGQKANQKPYSSPRTGARPGKSTRPAAKPQSRPIVRPQNRPAAKAAPRRTIPQNRAAPARRSRPGR